MINLISAALEVDSETLESTPFTSIAMILGDPGESHGEIELLVERGRSKDRPVPALFYTIKGGGPDVELKRTELERRYSLSPLVRARFRELETDELRSRIQRVIRSTWLAVHRGAAIAKSSESSVESRLKLLSQNMVKFFSILTNASEEETRKFQKIVFSSLIPRCSFDELIKTVSTLDIKAEEETFREIMRDFSISSSHSELDGYFKNLMSATKKLKNLPAKTTWNFGEHRALVLTELIHGIVKSWETLKEKQREIYEPKKTFLRVLDDQSWNKKFSVNSENELEAHMTNSDVQIPLSSLSSGEKQLLIILGEALLQRRLRTLYIADEPELSLHVKWQEKLIDMLLEINPQSQILFATHSPDIVAHYQNRVFDMEKLFDAIH